MTREELKQIIRDKVTGNNEMVVINSKHMSMNYNIDEKRIREAFAELFNEEIIFIPAHIKGSPNLYFRYRVGIDDVSLIESYLETERKRIKSEYQKRMRPLKKLVRSEVLVHKLGHLELALEGEQE